VASSNRKSRRHYESEKAKKREVGQRKKKLGGDQGDATCSVEKTSLIGEVMSQGTHVDRRSGDESGILVNWW
jgi:hypothetical protein